MASPLLALKTLRNRPQVSVGSNITNLLLATGAGVGIFFGIRAISKNFKRGIRERQALNPQSAASFATQFKLAFENDNAFGWGTDEEAVYRTVERIPDRRTFGSIQKAYKDLYGNSLAADLKSELSSEEYQTLIELIRSKF